MQRKILSHTPFRNDENNGNRALTESKQNLLLLFNQSLDGASGVHCVPERQYLNITKRPLLLEYAS